MNEETFFKQALRAALFDAQTFEVKKKRNFNKTIKKEIKVQMKLPNKMVSASCAVLCTETLDRFNYVSYKFTAIKPYTTITEVRQ